MGELIMQPLVSVIVPVYKVEEYLPRCLDSLCRQSLKNIEILLIDDASPDQCGRICEQYAAKDPRFKVIHHTENKGLSAARNTGIRQAIANYLMFVDSDDWVHEDFCKEAYECAVHNKADLVMFGYQHVREKHFYNKSNNLIRTDSDGPIPLEEAINLTFTEFGTVAWNKLYSRTLFNNIKYPEGQVFEDSATTYKLIWNASQIYCIKKVLYYYCQRGGSITKRNYTKRIVQEKFKVCWQECCDLSSWGFWSKNFESYKISTALFYCIASPLNYTDPYYAISADILLNTKKIPPSLTWKRIILVKLFQCSPNLFNIIFFYTLNKYIKSFRNMLNSETTESI